MAKKYETKDIRNVGLFGHRGAGKTSLAEAILFDCKESSRLGSVDAKTSNFDYTEEEQARGFTISLATGHTNWKKHRINLIDTPGDSNFLTDARNAVHVVDLAVMVLSVHDGVEVGTEKLWASIQEAKLPRVLFVNKVDKERAEPENALSEIQESFPEATPVQLPLGKAASFEGVVDLIEMKAHRYPKDGSGTPSKEDIPSDLADEAAEARKALVERVAESDDTLLEKYLETEELTAEEFTQGFCNALKHGTIVPLLYGSSTLNMGIQPLLDLLVDYGPTPLEHPPLKILTANDEESELVCSSEDPLVALVFKTIVTRSGKFSFFRVFSGATTSNFDGYNGTKDTSERIGALLQFNGKNQTPVDEAITGDIVAVAKLKNTDTGDTLCTSKNKVHFDLLQPPVPLISFAVKGDEEKIVQAINKLREEDFALQLGRNEQAKEILLRGQGQIHIEVALEKIRNQFKLDVELHPPTIAYKETIRGTALGVEGKHKKQSGGRGQFGVCYIDMKPAPTGDGFVFEDAIVGGVIPKTYIPAVEKGVVEAAARGPLAGYPTVDFHVRLHDGKTHPVDSSEQAFKMAGIKGFRAAVSQCNPVILEPHMLLEVTVPADLQGTINGDLNSRRARLEGTEYHGKYVTIKAKVPESEILSYANQLNSMTEARGTFSVSFSHYEQVPPPIQEKIIAEAKARQEEEG